MTRLDGGRDPLGLQTLSIDWASLLGALGADLPAPDRPLALTVVGCGPEARYLLDCCAAWPAAFAPTLIGRGPRPVWLGARRYRRVRYLRQPRGELPRGSGPLLLLDPPPPGRDPQLVYQEQVGRLTALLDGPREAILCLTGLPRAEPDPRDELDRELERTARRLAGPDRQVLVLRVPDRYGPHGDAGLCRIAHLMFGGQLLAPPAPDETPIGHLHLADLARALLGLILRRPAEPYACFEWGPDPAPLGELMARLEQLPRQRLLGEPSGLACLLGIGYQREVQLPYQMARGLPLLRGRLQSLLEPLRYRGWHDGLCAPLLDHLFAPCPTPDRQPLEAHLGLEPLPPLAGLDQTLSAGHQTGWHQFLPTVEPDPRAATERRLAAATERILDELERLDPTDLRSRRHPVELPIHGAVIDLQSLHVLIEEIRRQGIRGLLDDGLEGLMARGLPAVLAQLRDGTRDWARLSAEETLEGPGPLVARTLTAARELTGQLLQDPGRHMRRTLLLGLFRGVEQRLSRLSPLLRLLPDRRIGLLLASELGTVGLTVAVEGGLLRVTFPRKGVDKLTRFSTTERQLTEFRKQHKLDAAAWAPLGRVLADLRRGQLISRLLHPGETYKLAGSTTHYRLLSREMFGTPYARMLFTDAAGRLVLGISTTGGSLSVLPPEELALYERLRTELVDGDAEALASLLPAVHATRQATRVLRLSQTRRLIGEVLRPTALGRIMALLERRARRGGRQESGS